MAHGQLAEMALRSTTNRRCREMGAKVAVRYTGYVDPGPPRPPFAEVPTDVDSAIAAEPSLERTLRSRRRSNADLSHASAARGTPATASKTGW